MANRKRQCNSANRAIDQQRIQTARSLSGLADLLGMDIQTVKTVPEQIEKPTASSDAEVDEYLKTMGGGK